MNREEVLKAIMELPKVKTNNPISSYGSVNVDDLMDAFDRFDKVPTYDELLRENKKQKEVIDRAIDYIKKYNVYFADCYEDKKGNIYSRDIEFVEIIPNDLLKILKEVSE